MSSPILIHNPSTELKAAIVRDSLVVESFLSHKYEAVARNLSMLSDEYGITLESWHQETLLHSIPNYEKRDIIATLTDICALLISLNNYISVTRKAVERISSKTTDALYELETLRRVLQTTATKWVKDMQSINAILQNLHPKEAPEDGSISLLLTGHRCTTKFHNLKEATTALRQDSSAALKKWLQGGGLGEAGPNNQTALLVLIKTATLCSSSKCLSLLVSRLSRMGDFIKYPSYNPLSLQILHAAQRQEKNLQDQDAYRGLRLILDSLQVRHWSNILLTPDSIGRLPLHYAAQHGMTATCRELVERINSLKDSSEKANLSHVLIPDYLRETPLSIAISQGHDEIVKLFLNSLHSIRSQVQPSDANNLEQLIHDLILLAIRSQRIHITEILIDNEPRLLTRHPRIHELLYTASQYGQASIVERLLAHPSCDISTRDHSGWTAVDHAAFRGPPALVKILQGQRKESPVALRQSEQHINLPAQRPEGRNLASKEVKLDTKTASYSHIFVNLGHFDMEKEPSILQIEAFRRLVAPIQIPDSSLTLEISGISCSAITPYVVPFPILEDLSKDPLHFATKDPNAAKLLFRVYTSVLGSNNNMPRPVLIGSAVASLKDAREGLGTSLESLERDHTVSLVSSDAFGSSYAGSVTFTFVISKPFSHQGPPPTPSKLNLRRDDSPWVAGHRGKWHELDYIFRSVVSNREQGLVRTARGRTVYS